MTKKRELEESLKLTDTGKAFINEALEQQLSDDCVSRASVKELFQEGCVMGVYDFLGIDDLPPVTPTHGTCKDCKYNVKDKSTTTICDIGHRFFMREPSTFYCADFERRK